MSARIPGNRTGTRRFVSDVGGVCRYEREGVGAVSCGSSARIVAAEEYAAQRRAQGEPATVVMDIQSDAFLVVVPGRDED